MQYKQLKLKDKTNIRNTPPPHTQTHTTTPTPTHTHIYFVYTCSILHVKQLFAWNIHVPELVTILTLCV